MVKENYNEDMVKIAFSNVKKDILELKKEIEEIKSLLSKKETKIGEKNKTSSGNNGVVVMPLLSCYYDVVTPKEEINIKNLNENLKILDSNIKKFVNSLSDKEFLIFITIYQLEDELKRPVTYEEISKKSNIPLFSLRNRLGGLILKKAPIIKEKLHNYKAMFSIKKEFRDLKIGDKLLNFRRSFEEQTYLSDIINI